MSFFHVNLFVFVLSVLANNGHIFVPAFLTAHSQFTGSYGICTHAGLIAQIWWEHVWKAPGNISVGQATHRLAWLWLVSPITVVLVSDIMAATNDLSLHGNVRACNRFPRHCFFVSDPLVDSHRKILVDGAICFFKPEQGVEQRVVIDSTALWRRETSWLLEVHKT